MGIGDELMVTGQCRVLQERDPRKVRIVYEKPRWWPIYDNNPRIARPEEVGDFQEFRPREGWRRPYIALKSVSKWGWNRYQAPRGEIYFSAAERDFGCAHAGRLIVEPHIKQSASPNKDWSFERWGRLVALMHQRGMQPTQVGLEGVRRLPGVEFIPTANVRLAAAVMANARAAVLPEGGLHHVAAAVGLSAVVIFGGFISPQVTGYADQVSIFETDQDHPLGCGWRVPCMHCRSAMERIPPERVFKELESVLDKAVARAVAA